MPNVRDLDIGQNEKVGPCTMVLQEVLTTSPPRSEDNHDVIAEQGVPCEGTGIMHGTT